MPSSPVYSEYGAFLCNYSATIVMIYRAAPSSPTPSRASFPSPVFRTNTSVAIYCLVGSLHGLEYSRQDLTRSRWLDWAVFPPPTQYRLSGRQFYRSRPNQQYQSTEGTRSQAVARIADRTAKNCRVTWPTPRPLSGKIICAPARHSLPLELHLTTSELWFGQEQEGILP